MSRVFHQVLILLGSPRKKGNTALLVSRLATQLRLSGHRVEIREVARMNIHPCIGCGNCEQAGRCVFDDDMTQLYEEILQADRIILASPIYFYGLTAQLKAMIDRCQTLWSRKYILGEQLSSRPDRQGYLISVAATHGRRVFEGAELCARYAFDAMDVAYGGSLLIPGVDRKGAITSLNGIDERITAFLETIVGE